MSCPSTTIIDPREYIGNSLDTINRNFTNLLSGICDNIDRIDTLALSASQLTNTTTIISNVITQGAAKAWVRFDGTRDSIGDFDLEGGRKIYSSYNIDLEGGSTGVTVFAPDGTPIDGYYAIDIMPDIFAYENEQEISYLVIGTSNNNTFVQPVYEYQGEIASISTTVVIRTVNGAGVVTPASNISVAIF
jgi:hypothetical protein